MTMKNTKYDLTATDDTNPYSAVLANLAPLTGQEFLPRPRLQTAVNTWAKTQADEINTAVHAANIAEGTVPGKSVAVWNRVAKQLYNRLTPEERKHWEKQAKENHERALAEWKLLKEQKISTSPADRQRCIEALVSFIQPVIDAMSERIGYKVMLLAGGPVPAEGGSLNVVSLHSGTKNDDEKLTSGQEMPKEDPLDYIMPTFAKFLKSSYTADECKARALPTVGDDNGTSADTALEKPWVPLDIAVSAALERTNSASKSGTSSTTASTTVNVDAGTSTATNIDANTSTSANTASVETHTTPSQTQLVSAISVSNNAVPSAEAESSSNEAQHKTLLPTAPASRDRHTPPRPLSLPPSVAPFPIISPRGAQQPNGDLDAVPLPGHSPTRRAASLDSLNSGSPLADQSMDVDEGLMDIDEGLMDIDEGLPPDTPSKSAGKRKGSQLAPDSASKRRNTDAPSAASESSRPVAAEPAAALSLSALPSASVPTGSAPATSSVPVSTSAITSVPISTHPAAAEAIRTATLWAFNPWLTRAISMLLDDSLGAPWLQLVSTWIAFEVKAECRPNGTLSAKGRPSAVSDWIQHARDSTWRPNIPNTEKYTDVHQRWWISLQPEWRVVDSEDEPATLLRLETGDLECLRKPGPNGMLSVVASLFFWGKAVSSAGKQSDVRWDDAVADVLYVLTRLL